MIVPFYSILFRGTLHPDQGCNIFIFIYILYKHTHNKIFKFALAFAMTSILDQATKLGSAGLGGDVPWQMDTQVSRFLETWKSLNGPRNTTF